MRNPCVIDKMSGVKLPHPLLKKVWVVLLGLIFLNTEPNKPHFLRDKMIFNALFSTNKAKIYLIVIFRAPVLTHFIVKV